MNNLHAIGPLPLLEKLVYNKIIELINSNTFDIVKQHYEFMSLVLDECKKSKDIQFYFNRVVDSFNGTSTDSDISILLPRIIKNKLDELNSNKELNNSNEGN